MTIVSSNETLALGVDESYSLEVNTSVGVAAGAHLTANTVVIPTLQ